MSWRQTVRYPASRTAIAAVIGLLALQGCYAATPRGTWLTSRKDPRNQARADVSGRMPTPPHEVWHISTGGEVVFSRNVQLGGRRGVLVQSSTCLELRAVWGEIIWSDRRPGIGQILHIGDFDGDRREEILATTDARTVELLDMATGKRLWTWRAEPSTQILGCAFIRMPSGIRFVLFPSYSVNGYCFDFSGNRTSPELLWQKSYEGKYGAGYGPSIVLKDMDLDGKQDIVLSGKVPSIYHAVIDAETGDIKFDIHYDLDGWGRPYGLLKATDLDGDRYPDLVMVSCQVEEYAAVARNVEGKRFEKAWAHFVEKDWPEDHKELRPQVTSVADLRRDGRPELCLGLWEDNRWRTLIIDPLKGFSAQRGSLTGLYFWGCHDLTGDGRPEILVSRERARRPSRATTLLALDGITLQRVAALDEAAVFSSVDSPLPEDTAFMAIRHNSVFLTMADGTSGILVRRFRAGRESGVYLWGGRIGQPVRLLPVAGSGFVRADVEENNLLLSHAYGGIQRFGEDLKAVGSEITASGRSSQPLVWIVDGKPELVFDVAGGRIYGGRPNFTTGKLDGRWEVPGCMPALHIDGSGVDRLSVADLSDPDAPGIAVYNRSGGFPSDPIRIPLSHPAYLGLTPFGKDYHLLVNLQTGVHTMALACYDSDGQLLWQDPDQGAHPRIPGAADLDGDGLEEVVADDHGVLRVYTASGVVIGTDKGWPPAYNLPILGPFGPDGEMLILRASGISGTSLIERTGRERWKVAHDIWRYYRSLGAVADTRGDGRFVFGGLAEDGSFDCIDLSSGKALWSVPLAEPNGTSVVAGDIDGNGKDEFLLGLSDGRLVCIAQHGEKGGVLWEKQFDAAVISPIIADADGDGEAEIVVSTSDGLVRILDSESKPSRRGT